MPVPMGILISSFDYSPVAEDEFHDWYDTEHLPERERIPGFLDCTRWLAVDLPNVSLNTYDLSSVEVLRSEGYLAVGYENNSPWTQRVGWRCIKRLRFEGIQENPGDRRPPSAAQGLAVIAMNADKANDDAVAQWLDASLQDIVRVEGVACARRFRATMSTHRHVLVCHLERAAVIGSDAWRQAIGRFSIWQEQSRTRDLLITNCARYRRTENNADERRTLTS